MGTITRMAWRSLGRNRRRSILTAAGMALATAMCMATLGLMDGLSLDLVRGTTDGEVGHVQIHHPEYPVSRRVADTVPAAAGDLAPVRAHAQVLEASRRLYAWGYLSSEAGAGGVQLMGLEPAAEARVTRMHTTLAQGGFVPAQPTPWAEAVPLSAAQQALDRRLTEQAMEQAFAALERPGAALRWELPAESVAIAEQLAPRPKQPPSAVLGSKLAANLDVGVGDTVHLLYENTLGAQGTLALRVVGLFTSGLDATDRSRVLLHVEDLQNMLLLPGRAHEIALRLHDPRAADAVARDLAALPGGDARLVQTWAQLRPDILALIASNQALMGSLVFIVFLIAGIGVLNTMLVSVMERQKELSLMKALGQAPRRIVALVLLETLLLSALACAAGLVVGAALNAGLQRWGLDVSAFGGFSMSGVSMAPVLRSSLSLESALLPPACLLLVALLAAWMPARMAARVSAAAGMNGR